MSRFLPSFCTLSSLRLIRHGGRAVLVGALTLSSWAAQAMDDPPGRVGRISESQGRVWLMEAGQAEWTGALRNRPFTTGDRLSTERGSRLELEVGSSTFRLDGGSELQVIRLDDDRIELQLVSGSLALRAREPEVAREIAVQTAEGQYQPRQPGLYRVDREGRGSLGAALSGELLFDSSDASLGLRGGQRAEFWFDPADQRTHYTWARQPNDDFAWWVQREDARDEQQAAQRPVSAEMTGASDLDRYGRWSNHPEYGALWTPIGVSVGWAPYRFGHWSWIAPWGWTWVDDAPWGFAPFHYGRWVFFGGQWCWAPGQYVRRPIYAPAMVAWVGAAPGVTVSVGVGPAVGWIPLAPREPYHPVYISSPRYIQQINTPYGQWQNRPVPHEPMMYTNRGVPGGVTMVPSQALAQRQPVMVAPRRIDDVAVSRVLRSEPMAVVAPPSPVAVQPGSAARPLPSAAPVPVPAGRPALPERREWSSRPEAAVPVTPPAATPRLELPSPRSIQSQPAAPVTGVPTQPVQPVPPAQAPVQVQPVTPSAPSQRPAMDLQAPVRRVSPVPQTAQPVSPVQAQPAAPASRQRDDDRGDRRSLNGGARRVE